MPSREEISQARQLMAEATQSLRNKDFPAAERAALTFLDAGFDHFKIRRVLAVVSERDRQFTKAARHLSRALRIQPGDRDAWFHLNRVLIASNDIDRAKQFVSSYPTDFPDLFGQKLNFYKLETIFHYAEEYFGGSAAIEWLAALLDVPETRRAVSESLTARKADLMSHAGTRVKTKELAAILEAIETGALAEAARLTLALFEVSGGGLDDFETVINDGPDAGHPIWHVVNPFYHLWQAADAKPEEAQGKWSETGAVTKDWNWKQERPGYLEWVNSEELLGTRQVLQDVIRRFQAPPRIIDLGCGTGRWLRFMAEHCSVPISALHGVELHETRTACARQALIELAAGAETIATINRNVRAGDLLVLDPDDIGTRYEHLDLVTLIGVTGCFDDARLRELATKISRLEPRFILTHGMIDQWDFWHGRKNEAGFFEAVGYEFVRGQWVPEIRSRTEARQLVGPRKYWVSSVTNVYERRA